MMPEQVWDEPDRPEARLVLGKPAGSAVPLVWAHAEYLKLLRSAVDGKVFDRIEPVSARYCERSDGKKARSQLEFFTFGRPIQKISVGDTLRILEGDRFEVRWSDDGWRTVQNTVSRNLGCAGHSADIPPSANHASGGLSWTLYWPEQNRWLGYNVDIRIEPQ
jgi:glucoamylase